MQPDDKFKQKYSPKSSRLQNYDYSSDWWCFITICTKDRENYFGEIVDWKMILNEYGEIVSEDILWISKHYINVEIDEFVVMPNHIHLIIFIVWNNVCRDVSQKHLYGGDKVCKDIPQKHLYGGDKVYKTILFKYFSW